MSKECINCGSEDNVTWNDKHKEFYCESCLQVMEADKDTIMCDVCEEKRAEYKMKCKGCGQDHYYCDDCIHINNCVDYDKLEKLK